MFKWIKDAIVYSNKQGIPLPIFRDNKSPSVSFTLLVVSSVFVMLGLLSLTIPGLKISFMEALSWHVTSAILYYNRGAKIAKDGIEIEATKDANVKEGSDS